MISCLLALVCAQTPKHEDRDLQFFAEHSRSAGGMLWCLDSLCDLKVSNSPQHSAVARALFPTADDPQGSARRAFAQAEAQIRKAVTAEQTAAEGEWDEWREDLPTPEQIEKEWASRIRVWGAAGWLDRLEPNQAAMSALQQVVGSVRKQSRAPEPGSAAKTLASPVKSGDLLCGRYRIEAQIGDDHIGARFLAWDLVRQAQVAVKIVNRTDEPYMRQVSDCVNLLGRVKSNKMAKFYGVEHLEDGRPLLVMEHLPGETLHERLGRQPRLSLAATQEIVQQGAAALGAAHDAGIVHRDIRPRNIFLCEEPGRPEMVKVIDFGLAKVPNLAVSQPTEDLGLDSFYFLPPEVIYRQDEKIAASADQWALAVLAYRMLAGRLPFEGNTLADLIRRIRWEPPAPLPDSAVPAAVMRVISRALSKRPEERFATIRDFAQALSRVAADSARMAAAAVSLPMAAQLPILRGVMEMAARASSSGAHSAVWQWTSNIGEKTQLKVSLSGELVPGTPEAKTDRYLIEWEVQPSPPPAGLGFRIERGENYSRWIRVEAAKGREFITISGDQVPSVTINRDLRR